MQLSKYSGVTLVGSDKKVAMKRFIERRSVM
jgi:hypothetical protein